MIKVINNDDNTTSVNIEYEDSDQLLIELASAMEVVAHKLELTTEELVSIAAGVIAQNGKDITVERDLDAEDSTSEREGTNNE